MNWLTRSYTVLSEKSGTLDAFLKTRLLVQGINENNKLSALRNFFYALKSTNRLNHHPCTYSKVQIQAPFKFPRKNTKQEKMCYKNAILSISKMIKLIFWIAFITLKSAVDVLILWFV